jgi:hypothetical protein
MKLSLKPGLKVSKENKDVRWSLPLTLLIPLKLRLLVAQHASACILVPVQ